MESPSLDSLDRFPATLKGGTACAARSWLQMIIGQTSGRSLRGAALFISDKRPKRRSFTGADKKIQVPVTFQDWAGWVLVYQAEIRAFIALNAFKINFKEVLADGAGRNHAGLIPLQCTNIPPIGGSNSFAIAAHRAL